MSILVVQLVREGLLFGADRNITTSLRRGPDVLASGQSPRPKVLRWPNRQVVVGYVGRASVAGQHADAWLYDFIGRNLDTNLSLRQLAENLKSDLECDLGAEVGADAMILHLGGFVEDAGQWKPQVWYIRNARGLDALGYKDRHRLGFGRRSCPESILGSHQRHRTRPRSTREEVLKIAHIRSRR